MARTSEPRTGAPLDEHLLLFPSIESVLDQIGPCTSVDPTAACVMFRVCAGSAGGPAKLVPLHTEGLYVPVIQFDNTVHSDDPSALPVTTRYTHQTYTNLRSPDDDYWRFDLARLCDCAVTITHHRRCDTVENISMIVLNVIKSIAFHFAQNDDFVDYDKQRELIHTYLKNRDIWSAQRNPVSSTTLFSQHFPDNAPVSPGPRERNLLVRNAKTDPATDLLTAVTNTALLSDLNDAPHKLDRVHLGYLLPITLASILGTDAVFDAVLNRQPDLNAPCADGRQTLHHMAAYGDRPARIARLVAAGADPSMLTTARRTPLGYAIENANWPAFDALADAGASLHRDHLFEGVNIPEFVATMGAPGHIVIRARMLQ